MFFKPLVDEKELLHRVSEGDSIAFARLFDAYHGNLGSYILRMTESIQDTEEIVQDVFIKVWLNRDKLTTINSFSDYLFIMCRNKTFNYLRKIATNKSRWALFERELEAEQSDTTDEKIEGMRKLLDKAIQQLPEQQRETLLLSRNDRLKYKEIAVKQGITIDAVKKRLSAARQFIKTYVNLHIDEVIICLILFPISLK